MGAAVLDWHPLEGTWLPRSSGSPCRSLVTLSLTLLWEERHSLKTGAFEAIGNSGRLFFISFSAHLPPLQYFLDLVCIPLIQPSGDDYPNTTETHGMKFKSACMMRLAAPGPFHYMNKPGLSCWRMRDREGINQGAAGWWCSKYNNQLRLA